MSELTSDHGGLIDNSSGGLQARFELLPERVDALQSRLDLVAHGRVAALQLAGVVLEESTTRRPLQHLLVVTLQQKTYRNITLVAK